MKLTTSVASRVLLTWLAVCAGCGGTVDFPMSPMAPSHVAQGALRAYDRDEDGRGDFFTFADSDGRIDTIGYDTTGDGKPDVRVNLASLPSRRCRHLVIVLDGFGFDVVEGHYYTGNLRMFHPPSLVIAPYPTLTDLAMADIFGDRACPAFEAKYFDRKTGEVVGGTMAYLAETNTPFNRLLHYRANSIWDGPGYVKPWWVFSMELSDLKRLFDKAPTQEMLAVVVSSAGISTRYGEAGQRKCLRLVERLVNQIICETRGLTKVTLLADHGHSYKQSRQAPLKAYLGKRGWRVGNCVRGPRDVAYVRFGLETYVSFGTRRPRALAEDLIACEGVDVVSFAEGRTVVIAARDGRGWAAIHRTGNRYRYEPTGGDPLELNGILAGLPGGTVGWHGADELLAATVAHRYPAPLQRLWRAHFSLVQNPPDVIASLQRGYHSGSGLLGGLVRVLSTHGSLDYHNSATFIMSTIGPLPAFMRSADIPRHLEGLTGRPFPLGR